LNAQEGREWELLSCKQGFGNEEESGRDLREDDASLVWWRRSGMEWMYGSTFLT
jgi:hypothetical protein